MTHIIAHKCYNDLIGDFYKKQSVKQCIYCEQKWANQGFAPSIDIYMTIDEIDQINAKSLDKKRYEIEIENDFSEFFNITQPLIFIDSNKPKYVPSNVRFNV